MSTFHTTPIGTTRICQDAAKSVCPDVTNCEFNQAMIGENSELCYSPRKTKFFHKPYQGTDNNKFLENILVNRPLVLRPARIGNSTPSNTLTTSLRVASLLLAGLTLSGCGGAPSESDIKSTMEADMKANTAMFEAMGVELKGIKKIGCKDDGEKAYKCDVEIEMSGNGTTQKSVIPRRFVKSSDGWRVTK